MLFGVWLFFAGMFSDVEPPLPITTGVLLEGKITYYSAGVMERVYSYRLGAREVEPCGECVGMIAVVDAEHIGKHAYITLPDQEPMGPFLIIDCARKQDAERLKSAGLIAEVSRERAYLWDMQRPIYGAQLFIMDDHR